MNELLAVFIVLGLLGAVAWLVRSGHLGRFGPRTSAVGVETAISLGERRQLVIVAVEGRRLLLVLLDEKTAKHVGENPLTVSRVRSAIIELLTTQTSAALATPEGRAELKKSIAQTTAQIAHVDVRDVLFKEFVVQ